RELGFQPRVRLDLGADRNRARGIKLTVEIGVQQQVIALRRHGLAWLVGTPMPSLLACRACAAFVTRRTRPFQYPDPPWPLARGVLCRADHWKETGGSRSLFPHARRFRCARQKNR